MKKEIYIKKLALTCLTVVALCGAAKATDWQDEIRVSGDSSSSAELPDLNIAKGDTVRFKGTLPEELAGYKTIEVVDEDNGSVLTAQTDATASTKEFSFVLKENAGLLSSSSQKFDFKVTFEDGHTWEHLAPVTVHTN